jgi:hypothetical protein
VSQARAGQDTPEVTIGLDAFNLLNRTSFMAYLGTINSPWSARPSPPSHPDGYNSRSAPRSEAALRLTRQIL